MRFVEYVERAPLSVGGVRVTPFEVRHPSGAPPYALRFEVGDKTIGFSGDTEWVEALLPVASGADLYISECFSFEKPIGSHMAWRTIEENLDRLQAKRVLLTHMGGPMLARCGEIRDARILFAEDGKVIDI